MTARARVIGVWVLVMVAAAVSLKILDRVPALLAGTPHRARVFDSIEEAERAVGASIWLPAYYPEELAWPPASIEATSTAPLTVVVRIARRTDGRERLVIAQSIGAASAPPADFLPAADRLGTAEIAVGACRATLARVLLGPYELHDLWWDQAGRRVTLRYNGPVETLLAIAASLERRAEHMR